MDYSWRACDFTPLQILAALTVPGVAGFHKNLPPGFL